jgi:hypothetical protein
MISLAAGVANNLFTFMCEIYLVSLTQLKYPAVAEHPIVYATNGAGAANSCTINLGTTATASVGTSKASIGGVLVTVMSSASMNIVGSSATATATATRQKTGKAVDVGR